MESSEFEVTIEQPDETIDRCRCPVSLWSTGAGFVRRFLNAPVVIGYLNPAVAREGDRVYDYVI